MKIIRDTFGLTQELLASYLNVTRSQLSVTETDGRTLPTGALKKCIAFLQIMKSEEIPGRLASIEVQQQLVLNQTLQKRLKECDWKLFLARKKMVKLQVAYTQCKFSLLAVETLQPQLPLNNETEKDKEWLEILASITESKLIECGLKAQQLLQLEIDLLKVEKAKLQEMMGG